MTRLRKMMLDEPGEALLSSSVVIIPRNLSYFSTTLRLNFAVPRYFHYQ